jgi:hypothetical protein
MTKSLSRRQDGQGLPASAHSLLDNVSPHLARRSEMVANVLATKPYTTSCVIDGIAVTITFFPDTGALRITDTTGARLRETRWSASCHSLVTTFRELSETPEEDRAEPETLFDCQQFPARTYSTSESAKFIATERHRG